MERATEYRRQQHVVFFYQVNNMDVDIVERVKNFVGTYVYPLNISIASIVVLEFGGL